MTIDEVNKQCDREEQRAAVIQICLWAITIILGIALSSCRSQSIQCSHENDSVRVEYRHDSVYIWKFDSVYVSEKQRHDTIFLTKEKWSIRYRDSIVQVHDTITTTKTETIVQTERYIPKFYKGSTIALWVLIAAIVVYIVIRVVKAIYLRR